MRRLRNAMIEPHSGILAASTGVSFDSWTCGSRCIEQSAVAFQAGFEIRVAHRLEHQEIDRPPDGVLDRFAQPEKRTEPWQAPRCELHEQVDVRPRRIEVDLARCGAHHLESPDAMELAEPLKLRKLLGEQGQHDPFSLLCPDSAKTVPGAGSGRGR